MRNEEFDLELIDDQASAHGEELADLLRLCSAGRIYDAEQWIQEGRPIQALTCRRPRKPALVSPRLGGTLRYRR